MSGDTYLWSGERYPNFIKNIIAQTNIGGQIAPDARLQFPFGYGSQPGAHRVFVPWSLPDGKKVNVVLAFDAEARLSDACVMPMQQTPAQPAAAG